MENNENSQEDIKFYPEGILTPDEAHTAFRLMMNAIRGHHEHLTGEEAIGLLRLSIHDYYLDERTYRASRCIQCRGMLEEIQERLNSLVAFMDSIAFGRN